MPSAPPEIPALFSRDALHPAALAFAEQSTQGDQPWGVAFSGGADSLALLLALCALWPERKASGKIVALHFNHHLRGPASDGDQQFCEQFCLKHSIPLRVGHWQHSGHVDVSEADARAARHAFFAEEMAKLSARVLWLGHQRDDIAETQLMRLARGSSTAGLAAPRPVQTLSDGRVFLRPLLTLSKKEITEALRNSGYTWREDATNTASAGDSSGDFFRNRIRRDVLPAWAASAENDALAGAALTRELLAEDDEALDAWLAELLPAANYTETALDLHPLTGKPRALWRRALRRWLPASELARAGFEALMEICQPTAPSNRTSIGDSVAVFDGGILQLEPVPLQQSTAPTFSVTLPIGPHVSLALPDGSWFAAEQISSNEALCRRIMAGEFDPVNVIFIRADLDPMQQVGFFRVRSWLPGDRYQPLGAPGSAKLQDLFVNRKIPTSRRLTLPVVCSAQDNIVWVPGLPPSDEWKITLKTPRVVRLTYQQGTCTVAN